MRTAVCVACRRPFPVRSATGALPAKCDGCDPDAAQRRRDDSTGQNRRNAARRQELQQLRARVAYLEEALAAGRLPRLDDRRAAGRDTVAIAVRRVGTAQCAAQTAQRLRELAAEAQAWADAIDAAPIDHRVSRDLQEAQVA